MIVPTLRVRDMTTALRFYTDTLDFTGVLVLPDGGYAVLARGGDELHLERNPAGAGTGIAAVLIDDPDALFATFRARGLDPAHKPHSPVHQGPLDQRWGTREFYADDPDGNTLRFVRR